jgi:hypothetical protein
VPRPVIVVYEQTEKLGNRLIPFSHVIAFAEEHGCRVLNPGFRDYRYHFEGTVRGLTSSYPRGFLPDLTSGRGLGAWWKFRRMRMEKFVSKRVELDPRVHRFLAKRGLVRQEPMEVYVDLEDPAFLAELRRKRILFVYAWQLRAYQLANKHREAIRSYFRPLPAARAAVEKTIQRCRTQGRTVIGVHVRMDDYTVFMKGKFWYSHDEYVAQMRHLMELFAGQEPVFLICSTDPFPAEKLAGIPHVMGPGQPVPDLYALAGCDYLIGPPSTFSGWASFYNQVPLYIMKQRGRLPEKSDFEVFREIELLYVDEEERVPRSERRITR